MRKLILGLALVMIAGIGGCRWLERGPGLGGWTARGGAYVPLFINSQVNPASLLGMGKWIDGYISGIYTGNGHYDGKARWMNWTANWQRIQNFSDIYFWNYDIRDPYVGAPFFGDPH